MVCDAHTRCTWKVILSNDKKLVKKKDERCTCPFNVVEINCHDCLVMKKLYFRFEKDTCEVGLRKKRMKLSICCTRKGIKEDDSLEWL